MACSMSQRTNPNLNTHTIFLNALGFRVNSQLLCEIEEAGVVTNKDYKMILLIQNHDQNKVIVQIQDTSDAGFGPCRTRVLAEEHCDDKNEIDSKGNVIKGNVNHSNYLNNVSALDMSLADFGDNSFY